MKKLLLGLAAMSMAIGFAACDDTDPGPGNGEGTACTGDSVCGGYVCDIPDDETEGVCLESCLDNADCSDGYACDPAGSGLCISDDGTNPGETAAEYDRVLIVSRTNDDKDAGDCRSPNPGPDIDYVKYVANGGAEAFPVAVDGKHGGFCGSEEMESGDWAPINTVELQLSWEDDGSCSVENAAEKYFFMGTGQPQADGETLAEGTGYIVVKFEDGDKNAVNLENDGEISVVEINKTDNDGEEMCTNDVKDRPGDNYDVYIVAKDAAITAGTTKISAPEFIRVTPNSAVGLYTHVITELPEAADNNENDNENGGVIGD